MKARLTVSRSVLIAGMLLFAIVAYFGLSTLTRGDDAAQPINIASARVATDAEPRLDVVTVPIAAQPHEIYASLKGRTEPERVVMIRSETTGVVVNAPVAEGTVVRQGALLCGLSVEARQARIDEAEAALLSADVDNKAAQQLADKGLLPVGQAVSAQATYDAAAAALNAARIEMRKTQIRAPFAGVFEHREAETGTFLAPGGACGELVDLDPILVAVDVAEEYAGRLPVGAPVVIQLSDGRTLEGKVRFAARIADANTRTFRVTAEAPNPENAVAAGLSADLRILLGEAPASFIPPAMLVLHDDGRVGVRHVDETGTVRFAPVEIVDDSADGVWVSGLPELAYVLQAGQDFIREGVRVNQRPYSATAP